MALPVALQLYSVRDDLKANFEETIKKVAQMGYQGVEFAGIPEGISFENARKIIDKYGLVAVSAHVGFGDMLENPEKVFTDYKSLGCDYVAIPWLAKDEAFSPDTIEETFNKIEFLGKKAKEAGLQLLYHNHNFEFEKIDGEYILDKMYNTVPEEYLKTQLDTCWVNVGGEDPAEYVRKYTGRAPVVHLKDFVGGGKEGLFELIGDNKTKADNKAEFDFRPVGYGVQNFPEILKASVDAGAKWVVVEQDKSTQRPPMEAVKMSREYLKSLGW